MSNQFFMQTGVLLGPPEPITMDEIRFVLDCIVKQRRRPWIALADFAYRLHSYLLQPLEPPKFRLRRTSNFNRVMRDVCIPQRPALARFWRP